MQPSTLATILKIASDALGLDVRDDRDELLQEIHECRH